MAQLERPQRQDMAQLERPQRQDDAPKAPTIHTMEQLLRGNLWAMLKLQSSCYLAVTMQNITLYQSNHAVTFQFIHGFYAKN